MPNHQYRKGVRCPDCQSLVTSTDRIHRNAIQTLLFPKSKRYKCDNCGLKFLINMEKDSRRSKSKADRKSSYDLPPIAHQSAATLDQTGYGKTGKRRTTNLMVTDCPDIPGIRNSAEKLAARRADKASQDLHKELKRLKNIEKKYDQVKKANQYLAKAAAHKH
ncbi:MAG TPA: hypothetical protein ENJ35_06340 [Gammaproteobacteria bacterium]|nr:hypothetical protein [Gammaproteobacteria bacterium]